MAVPAFSASVVALEATSLTPTIPAIPATNIVRVQKRAKFSFRTFRPLRPTSRLSPHEEVGTRDTYGTTMGPSTTVARHHGMEAWSLFLPSRYIKTATNA